MVRNEGLLARGYHGIPPYEIVEGKPFHGPHSRAKAALSTTTTQPVAVLEFFEYLRCLCPGPYADIGWVRFQRYTDLKSGFEFRLAVLFVRPIPSARQTLFDLREDITHATGWYPLVMGQRASVHRTPIDRFLVRGPGRGFDFGRPLSIADVSNGHGQSLLLSAEGGSILLDAGFDGVCPVPSLQAVFLSHFHGDHSRGIWNVLSGTQANLVTSRVTLAYLQLVAGAAMRETLFGRVELAEDHAGRGISDSLSSFPTFHAPGSHALLYTDGIDRTVVYVGDCCIRNGFFDYSSRLQQELANCGTPVKWVILDAATVHRTEEDLAINEENSPNVMLRKMVKGLGRRSIVFLSDSAELLVYAYLRAFDVTRGSQTKIFLNANTYNLCRILWRDVVNRGPVDLVVSSLFKGHAADFIESHRVYPLQSISRTDRKEDIAAFATPSDIEHFDHLRDRVNGSDVVLLGTLGLRKRIPEALLGASPWQVFRVSSPDWAFHSAEADLASFIKRIGSFGWSVILYHNSSQAIDAFIQRWALPRCHVQPASTVPIPLRCSV